MDKPSFETTDARFAKGSVCESGDLRIWHRWTPINSTLHVFVIDQVVLRAHLPSPRHLCYKYRYASVTSFMQRDIGILPFWRGLESSNTRPVSAVGPAVSW